MIDPTLVTVLSGLGGAGGVGLFVKLVLKSISDERDRQVLYCTYMDSRQPEDVEAVARSLRMLRYRRFEERNRGKAAAEVPKPPRAIEASQPDAPPSGDGPPQAA